MTHDSTLNCLTSKHAVVFLQIGLSCWGFKIGTWRSVREIVNRVVNAMFGWVQPCHCEERAHSSVYLAHSMLASMCTYTTPALKAFNDLSGLRQCGRTRVEWSGVEWSGMESECGLVRISGADMTMCKARLVACMDECVNHDYWCGMDHRRVPPFSSCMAGAVKSNMAPHICASMLDRQGNCYVPLPCRSSR